MILIYFANLKTVQWILSREGKRHQVCKSRNIHILRKTSYKKCNLHQIYQKVKFTSTSYNSNQVIHTLYQMYNCPDFSNEIEGKIHINII